MYAQAINLNGAVDDYQLGLGKAMGQIGLISKDTAKLQAASKVLAEVVPANPFKSEYQKTLAEVFGVLADQVQECVVVETDYQEMLVHTFKRKLQYKQVIQ